METDLDPAVFARYQQIQALAELITQKCQSVIDRLGFESHEVKLQPPQAAKYYLEQDTGSGEYSLKGDWLDQRGMKQGSLVFHADGSFFVEQDVVKTHPTRKNWFVEAVNAWGREDTIKAEARLLPMPE